ncbi:hypothetical protein DAEQUDRAFT_201330 [Daedalea quercina L-15889]|uniref:Uncharacterized protein n=1 Tax=Daedalea quercina L-15889 TaxID=1314783 RepID=A0A165UA17_9APHY|nr:hypothetical protein DAEQUDRAFT_201330 [Daedalea quercina L-15889]
MLPGIQGPIQGIAPRESTPSPSFRERQRATKAHSLPIVPSLNQLQERQSVYPQGRRHLQESLQSLRRCLWRYMHMNKHRRVPPPHSCSPLLNRFCLLTSSHFHLPALRIAKAFPPFRR